MAGMFYSLKEVIEKLGKTEAEIKTLVREGKLREFRDGAKQLYKVEDVDALSAVPKEDAAILDDSLQLAIDETGEVSLAPEELDALTKDESNSEFKLDETGELMAEESLDKSESAEEILLTPEEEPSLEALSQEDTKTAQDSKIAPAADGTDIFETPEEKEPVTDDDTKIAVSGDSISVLGDSDTEFNISGDTSGETKLVDKKGPKSLDEKGGDELSVERLDADINLESGGSGSGLLDLSLQADDTSLGAVLDDIYTDSPTSPAALEQTPANDGVAIDQEAEQMFDEAETPEETAAKVLIDTGDTVTPAAAPVLVIAEPEADMASNAFGFSLFVPLALLIYTSIVLSSAYKPINNLKMLSVIEPIVWYVGAGAGAVAILIVLMGSFMSAGAGKPKKAKKVKVKKEEKPKAKKEKKPKKEKKAKKGKESPPEEE